MTKEREPKEQPSKPQPKPTVPEPEKEPAPSPAGPDAWRDLHLPKHVEPDDPWPRK